MDDDDNNNKRIVRKTYSPPVPPSPPPATETMSAEQSVSWNSWANGLIAGRLNEVAEMLGAETGQIEARLQKQISALEKEVVELKIENAYARGKEAGTIIDLPSTPKSWRRDVV
jgi:hypothetical protein